MTRLRWTSVAAGLLLAAGGALWSLGSPRITLLNSGLLLDRPPAQGLACLLAAVGAVLLAAAVTRAWLRAAGALIAAAAVLFAAQGFRYRIGAGAAALSARGLVSTTRIPWSQVQHVEQGDQGLVVWGTGESQIRLETGSFTPEQRAMLERTVARRLKEGKEAAPSPPAATPD